MTTEFREEFQTREQAEEFVNGLTYFPSESVEVDDEPAEEIAADDSVVFVVSFRKIIG